MAVLALIAAVVAAAFGLAELVPAVSPLIGAMLLGALAAPLAARCRVVRHGGAQLDSDRVGEAARWLLRAGIVLLGLRISLGDLAALGLAGAAIAAGTLAATLAATLALAPRMRVERDLALLIGAGSAICGASAIAAMQPLTRARDADVGLAVATVTLFGTLAMLAIPAAGPALGLDARATGLWAGAAIHEVAQVAAAGAAISAVGLQLATLVKLGRVALLAPAVATMGALRGRGGGGPAVAPVPFFVLAFLGCVLARTLLPIPPLALDAAALAATLLLAGGLAGLGLGVRPAALRAAGPRPLLLGAAAALTAALTALALVALLAA
ncbi:MAG TPA: putative sulfate exporter family transporter [Capillimicrobium sp.]